MVASSFGPVTQPDWQHREATVNGVRLHYVEAGSGPLVVLLHGFPEFWYSWRHQIPALAAAGFHVIAVDQRGYNESEKPPGVSSYRIEALTEDVAELIRHAGAKKATIVGHDWGGVVAWAMPVHHPDVVDRLVVLNGPHPGAFARELKTFDQLRRSWYILFFQMPWLPELLLSALRFKSLDFMLRNEASDGAFSAEDIALYKEALGQPGALRAAVNWYRAAFRKGPRGAKRLARPLGVKTLLIWGDQDRHLSRRLTTGLERWVPDLTVEHIAEATHWVQNDAPERVNWLITEFLRRP